MLEPAHAGQGRSTPRKLLSAREREVLEMASQGLTNMQIAQRLDLSVHAVKFHLAAVYRKLGATNRTQAAFLLLAGGSGGVAGDGEQAV